MPRTITANVQTEIEATSSTPVHLLKLEITGGTTYYYCDMGRSIVYDSHTWGPETFDFTDVTANRYGTRLSCQIEFQGPNHDVSGYFITAGGGTGHTITLYEAVLDADRAVIADPIILIKGASSRVQRRHNKTIIQVEQNYTEWKASIPTQIISDTTCQAVFNHHNTGGQECQYAGRAIGNITQAADARVNFAAAHGFSVGDDLYFRDIVGMVELNGVTAEVVTVASNAKSITSWGASNPAQINKVAHGFSTGEVVYISGAGGADAADVNGKYFVVTKVNDDQITIPIDLTGKTVTGGVAANYGLTITTDSSAFTAYTSGGYAMGTWCDKTMARCTVLGNQAHALIFVDAVAPGETVNFGSGYDSAAEDRMDYLEIPDTTGHLGVVGSNPTI